MNLNDIPPDKLCHWLGIVCLAVSFIFIWKGAGAAGNVEAMEETPTSPAATIQKPGYYEVKGRVVCDDPLIMPGSDRSVVYYRHRIWEEYEEHYRDKNGYPQTRTVENLLKDETEFTEFYVEDESGRILVRPKGAQIDADVLLNRMKPQEHGFMGGGLSGAAAVSMGMRAKGKREQKHQVIAIPVGNDLYALGPVLPAGDGGALGFKSDKREDRPFILSVRSEEEQTSEHRFFANMFNFGGIVFGAIGAGLLAWANGYL